MRTAQKLQLLRTRANITQEQLAQRLFVSRELVSKWELGQRRPDIRMTRALAEIYNIDIEYLLDDEEILAELSSCIPGNKRFDALRIRSVLTPFIDTLPERERAVFIRRYFFLEDAAEIGRVFGIKDNYVRAVLARTRKKLKNYMKGASE